MNNLLGVYWDLDGTIANTELEAHLPAFNLSFKNLDIDWCWDEETYINLLKINGGLRRISYYSSKNKYDFEEKFLRKIHLTKQKFYLDLINQGKVSLKVGVYRLIKELMERNIKQYVITSSSKSQVRALMNNLFKEFNPFEFFITSEDVEFHKPNPLPYLKAISKSGINPKNLIVFEDSNPGLESAIAANLPTIFVPSNIPIELNKNLNVKCIVDTIGDVNNNSIVVKGPVNNNTFVDYEFLHKFLNTF